MSTDLTSRCFSTLHCTAETQQQRDVSYIYMQAERTAVA